MRICLVGHSAAGLLSSSAGGSERQSALLAKALAARGHDVSFVVTGLAHGEGVVSGVRLRSGWNPDRGMRFVRAATYRYPHLSSVLRAQDADVYYSRGAGFYTPFVVGAARARDAVCVLGLASDRDLYPDSGPVLFGLRGAPFSSLVARLAHKVYRDWALPSATWVAVQNQEQADACSRLRLRNAKVPNIVLDPPVGLAAIEPVRDALWAGYVTARRRSKGLEELAALAGALPAVTFTVVGELKGDTHLQAIERLANLPNVDLRGPLPHDEAQAAIAAHRLVLNTSPSEGFSNVMLEGWALGRPCVTLSVNPSGLLTGDRLGVCSGGDLTVMAAAVVALLEENDGRCAMGERARRYVADTHAPARVCAAFEELAGARPESLPA
jgi:glycosyltransferase involved in cell wall biosynthesis